MTLVFATATLVLLPTAGHGKAPPHRDADSSAAVAGGKVQLCQGMGETNDRRDLEQPDSQQRDLEMGDDAARQDRLEQGDQGQQQLEAPDQRQQALDTPGSHDQDQDDGDDQGN